VTLAVKAIVVMAREIVTKIVIAKGILKQDVEVNVETIIVAELES